MAAAAREATTSELHNAAAGRSRSGAHGSRARSGLGRSNVWLLAPLWPRFEASSTERSYAGSRTPLGLFRFLRKLVTPGGKA